MEEATLSYEFSFNGTEQKGVFLFDLVEVGRCPDCEEIYEGGRTQCEYCGITEDEEGNDVGEGTALALFTAIKCPICANGRYHVSESERTIPVAGWLAHLDEHFQ